MKRLWNGLRKSARNRLQQRNYAVATPARRLGTTGLMAGELLAVRAALAGAWIPGVELVPRHVFAQPGRGHFAELARNDGDDAARIGFWPRQWSAARMFSGTVKGFHIHPPHVPPGTTPGRWFRRLFVDEPENRALRPYDREQWDMMFFIQGIAEMLLVDEREGMKRRVMRFTIYGDDRPGVHNAAVIIPPGVAHAIRAEAAGDLLMVYGTSTRFDPAHEGRLASDVETVALPRDWVAYLARSD